MMNELDRLEAEIATITEAIESETDANELEALELIRDSYIEEFESITK